MLITWLLLLQENQVLKVHLNSASHLREGGEKLQAVLC